MSGSINLVTIRNTVRTRGDYLSSVKFKDAYVNGEIQASWSELYEVIADTWEGWWDKESTLSTVAAQPNLALPSDAWRVQGVDVNYAGEWRELRQVGIGDRNRFQASSACPVAYRLSSRGLELYPTPDAAYQVRVVYTPVVTPLSETVATNLYNDWQEFVIEAALLKLDERQEKPIQERWTRLYDPQNGLKTRISNAASKRRSQEPEYLQLREVDDFFEGIY